MAEQQNPLNADNPRNVIPHQAIRQPSVTVNRRTYLNLAHVRERLFHTLFYRAALAYARAFPKPLRRFIEFVMLIKAFTALFVLVYIHFSFSKTANTCLDSVVSNWPRDGILRVEIIRNLDKSYSLADSYAKEEKITQLAREEMSGIMGLIATNLDIEPSTMDHGSKEMENISERTSPIETAPCPSTGQTYINESLNVSSTKWSLNMITLAAQLHSDVVMTEKGQPAIDGQQKAKQKLEDSRQIDKGDAYIYEYSLEYGFLRLSPAARAKLNIPVKVVFLDPTKDACFGDSFSRLLLEEFLGYNDILMTSVKAFAEREDNKGYLKNVVTGENYRFVNLWMAKTAYIPAVMCMLIFTVIVSMLLRYAHHQIFIFIVDLLQMLEFNMPITFPTAPLLTVILALVGIEAIMSEFFNDTTTAFYVILIVWLADQYDAICCHTPITKRHWLNC
ncbi:membralin [Dendroctonus ponderosae]|uniref:membralin n=1 Tax=Dendroctonus ponderosae TaxID=77166 RepID=UPI0020362735|nr:membralin [Dendroctonus ponderosae]